jgi:hypothetical protein
MLVVGYILNYPQSRLQNLTEFDRGNILVLTIETDELWLSIRGCL